MSRKIDVAGILLDDDTAQDALGRIQGFWASAEMNTIEMISIEHFFLAKKDEALRRGVEILDLAIAGDSEILRIAGVGTPQRIRETEEGLLFREFALQAIRDGRSVFLVGDTMERVEACEAHLKGCLEGLSIVGGLALEGCGEDADSLVNEINAISPDVVLSVLPPPQQEHFLLENRSRVDAKVWFGLAQGEMGRAGRRCLTRWLRRRWRRIALRRLIRGAGGKGRAEWNA